MDLLLTQEPASLYGGIEAAAATLQRAFFENKSQPEVLGRLVEESSKTVDEIILGQARKATRPFVFWDEEGRQVGASEVAVYAWETLGKQLLMKSDGESIWLTKMHKELIVSGDTPVAVELAYFAVNPDYWGMGCGRYIFSESMKRVLVETGDTAGCLFTIAMGEYAHTGKGQQVKEFLLNREKAINGKDSEGWINVTGEKFPLAEMEVKYEFTRDKLTTRGLSVATEVIAQKLGWKNIGLSTNLSPVYGAEIKGIGEVIEKLGA